MRNEQKAKSCQKRYARSFFRSTGLVKEIKLKSQRRVTTKCLPTVLVSVNIRGLMLDHDNVSSHSAPQTVGFLRENKVKVVEHPPCSPNLAKCNGWL